MNSYGGKEKEYKLNAIMLCRTCAISTQSILSVVLQEPESRSYTTILLTEDDLQSVETPVESPDAG
jgi:hypothetical protein